MKGQAFLPLSLRKLISALADSYIKLFPIKRVRFSKQPLFLYYLQKFYCIGYPNDKVVVSWSKSMFQKYCLYCLAGVLQIIRTEMEGHEVLNAVE
jgi:hypothetical protein